MIFRFGKENKPKSAAEIAQGKFDAKVKRQNTLEDKKDISQPHRSEQNFIRNERPHFGDLDLIPLDQKEEESFVEGTGFVPIDQIADPSRDWEQFGESLDHDQDIPENNRDYHDKEIKRQEREWERMIADAENQEDLGKLITEKMLAEGADDIIPPTKTRAQVNKNKTKDREHQKDENKRHLWNDFHEYTKKFYPEFYDREKKGWPGKDYDSSWQKTQTSETWFNNLFKKYLSWRKETIDPRKIS